MAQQFTFLKFTQVKRTADVKGTKTEFIDNTLTLLFPDMNAGTLKLGRDIQDPVIQRLITMKPFTPVELQFTIRRSQWEDTLLIVDVVPCNGESSNALS